MADVPRKFAQKSKKRSNGRGRYRDRKQDFRAKQYEIQSDKKFKSLTPRKKQTPKKWRNSGHCEGEKINFSFKRTSIENCHTFNKLDEKLKSDSPSSYVRGNTEDDFRISPNDRINRASFLHDTNKQGSTNINFTDFSLSSLTSRINGFNHDFAEPYNNARPLNNQDDFSCKTGTNCERIVKYDNRLQRSTEKDEFVESLFQQIDYLTKQVEFLTQENEKLKFSSSNMRDSVHNSPQSEVTITFHDGNLEQQFSPLLYELISCLISERISIEELQQFLLSKRNLAEELENWNALPAEDLFVLDNSTCEPNEGTEAPRYEKNFDEILQDNDLSKDEDASKSKKTKKSKVCFNCSEDHVTSKCPYPFDHRKVAIAKRNFTKSFYTPTVRYHAKGSKESNFKPGVISDELRDALGLGLDQIPPYIYCMRVLNYPPGWLEEASVESSGITLYGLNGNAQAEENSLANEGGVKVQYDPEKLVDFPGFNAPLPPDIIDECNYLGFPPMQPHLLRSVVEQTMTKPDVCPKRKRKLTLSNDQPSKVQRLEEDMEVDDDLDNGILEFNPPLPDEILPPPPPEDPPELPPEENDPPSFVFLDSCSNSPQPEFIKEDLALNAEPSHLQDSTDQTSLLSLEDLEERQIEDLEEIRKRLEIELQNRDDSEASLSNDVSSISSLGSEQRTEIKSSGSKLVTLGTPSLSRHSSFQKLPDYDNFAKDVTSHLNFENLPNSTGTYQKMKKVIKKVKETINSLIQ